MKKLFFAALLFVAFLSPSVGHTVPGGYGAPIGLTGGCDGCLDKLDGTGLADGSIAWASNGTHILPYVWDDDAGLTEAAPYIITPDTNAGGGNWLLRANWQNATADSGSAIVGQGGWYFSGGAGITTKAGNNTISISANTNASTDSGTATANSDGMHFTGSNGLGTSGAGKTVTISANTAGNNTSGVIQTANIGNQTSATAATTPEWAFHTDKKYHYFASRDMSLTNATFKVQTNFFPQFVSLHVWDEGDVPKSWGFFDRFGYGTNAASFGVQKSGSGTGANTASDTFAYRLRLFDSGTSVTWHLSVSTWDSDGVTFQWGKYQGEPTGTAYCSIVIE